ncbi:lysophospholipid acyltransferase family protein [Candidatus Halobeggiatoa sp. HSG11]|nr:lysophospholipid acyltransferase family protein [Candidatus Halobeggiatoa sp. HSG11]
MLFLRSLLFYIGMISSLMLWGPLIAISPIFPYPMRYRLLIKWGHFTVWWLGITCKLTYKLHGVENLPQTPSIVLSKHQSACEAIMYLKIFPMQTWLLKHELLWIPIYGLALKNLDAITIKRQNIRKSMQLVIEKGRKSLSAGRWLIIFPEGTRVPYGEKKRYGIGGALLAEKTGYPVIPVAHNAGKFWPKQSFIKQPGIVDVVIGPVIDPKGKTYQEINALAEEWIEKTMESI